MKILFVTDLYPIKRNEKTTPRTLHNFVLEWKKLGIDVDVVKPNFLFNTLLRNKPVYKTQKYKLDGVSIYNLNYFLPFVSSIERKLPEELSISNYDIIIAHMPSGIIWANKIARKYKKPLICGVHSSDISVLTQKIYSTYFAKALRSGYDYSYKIACRSDILRDKFCKILPNFSSKTFVAPSGIDASSIFEREMAFHYPIRVLTCANLIKRKNVDKLIEAMKELKDFKLTVVGNGKEYRKLKRLGKGIVRFSGRLDNQEVLNEMKLSDIFILPSINETFGMVYLEALSTGCVTVCTKNDGISGIIVDEKNGFLCEPTVDGIKEVLLKIKKWNEDGAKKAHFFGSATLAKIVENGYDTAKNYTLENCAKNYLVNLKTS